MITSTLSQLHWYKIISPWFAKAIDYALHTDLKALETGKYQIDGDNVFVIINEYTTKSPDECDPESHREYADIQIMLTGTEKFGYTPLEGHPASIPYEEEKDVAFYDLPDEEINYITLPAGQFIIFFPSDIHQPEVFRTQPALVKKAVFKVAVD